MVQIAIVYFSGSGHTHLMAEAVADGVRKVADTNVKLLRITGEQVNQGRWNDSDTLNQLENADAIVFGSPTYMGGIASQFKAFIDAASAAWFARKWKDKIAAGFTHSGSPSGDKQGTLLYLATNAAQHGMIWVGLGEMPNPDTGINRLGGFLGAMGNLTPNANQKEVMIEQSDRLTAESLGQRVAEATKRWNR
ncbi:flavodoxin family protein [Spirulina sp. CS-785/01]|uniref:flavodoxin family protein n=1 Tax=Spirulina sp. CS-785/01 TaxID=3021716 RepID=UPI00232B9570|nr:flavodoxin family protein [Spirulina sp. CS-785/01]MDB9312843.1 flavodoxin family protein [Spirulina sp. CS-785/01]